MSIAVRTYSETGSAPLEDPKEISETIRRHSCDFARVAEEFQLHPLAMEDARKHGQRPKL